MHKKIRTIIILILALALVAGAGFIAIRTLNPHAFIPQTQAQRAKTEAIKTADKKNNVTIETPISHDGITLYGKLTAPSNYASTRLPLIIMSHGYDSNADIFDSVTGLVAHQGYMVYTFDFYGGGSSTRSGDPDMLDMSVQTEKADLTAVLNYWKAQSFVDASHIYLAGASHGGLISAMVAADQPHDVKAMILVAPAFNVPDLVHSGFNALGYTDISQVPNAVTYQGRSVGKRYVTDAFNLDISAIQKAYAGPVLIVHGTADQIVPYSYSEQASHTYANAQLVPLDNVGHTADASSLLPAVLPVQTFLKEN